MNRLAETYGPAVSKGIRAVTPSLRAAYHPVNLSKTASAGTVRAAPVEILHAESERVFVRAALPTGTLLINEGPQRVTVGQQVTLDNTL